MSLDLRSQDSNRMNHQLHPLSNIMSLGTMSIGPRAVNVQSYKDGMVRFGNWGGQIWTQLAMIGATCPFAMIHVTFMNSQVP